VAISRQRCSVPGKAQKSLGFPRTPAQNHYKTSDVSTKHYDRYDAPRERRAAVEVWSAYLDLVLVGKIREIGQSKASTKNWPARSAR
jgi:hypothetical protein